MSHELTDYRYHARDLQLHALAEQGLTVLEATGQILQIPRAQLALLLLTPRFLVQSRISNSFASPDEQKEILAPAIGYEIEYRLIRQTLQNILKIAHSRSSKTINLDGYSEITQPKHLPDFQAVFNYPEELAKLIADSTKHASDTLLELIGTKSPILSPRRDIALMTYPHQVAIKPRESIFMVESAVEGVGLKLLFLENDAFPLRSVFVNSLQ